MYRSNIEKQFIDIFIIILLILLINNMFLLLIENINLSIYFLFNIIFSIVIIILLFIKVSLFKKLTMYFKKTKIEESILLKNETYIWYGKNVAGAIHNIKNKLTPIYLILNEIKDTPCIDIKIRTFIGKQINSSDNIINLLNRLLLIVNNKKINHEQYVNVNEICSGLVDFLKIDLELKNNINIRVDNIGRDLFIKIKPNEFIKFIELIIKEVCNYIIFCDNQDYNSMVLEVNSEDVSISISYKFKTDSNYRASIGITTGYGLNGKLKNSLVFINKYIKYNRFRMSISSHVNNTEKIVFSLKN